MILILLIAVFIYILCTADSTEKLKGETNYGL